MMERKTFKLMTLLVILAITVIFIACGSDDATFSIESNQAKTIYGLGECNASNNGMEKLVTSENLYYKCENGNWNTAENSSNNTLYDSRDGKTYKIVTIGSQTWMAENLNYETTGSWCYNDVSSYCDVYGRLYTWAAAQNACPTGWRLPSNEDWEILVGAVGGWPTAGKMLKSQSDLWVENSSGTDAYGFSALPAGTGSGKFLGRNNDVKDMGIGSSAFFWATISFYNEYDYNQEVYFTALTYSYVSFSQKKTSLESHKDLSGDGDNYIYSDNGYSVRCVKD